MNLQERKEIRNVGHLEEKKKYMLPERMLVESHNQQMLLATTYPRGSKGNEEAGTLPTVCQAGGGPGDKPSPEVTIYDQACKYSCLNSQKQLQYSWKSISEKERVS